MRKVFTLLFDFFFFFTFELLQCEHRTLCLSLSMLPNICLAEFFFHLSLPFSFPLLFSFSSSISFHLITPQLLPKHCAETISAARYRKQKKPVPKKGEVKKEKPGAESLRKDRTVATKSALLFVSLSISISSSPYLTLCHPSVIFLNWLKKL